MAAPDPQLSNLLKWSIENSSASTSDPTTAPPSRPLNPEALKALFGGPSDAELMKSSMAAIQSPEVSRTDKLTAFDNFEQLIESIDNANNIGPLGLWTPLVEQLDAEEKEGEEDDGEIQLMAAWCVGTAVQNNPTSQERALVAGAVPRLVRIARTTKHEKLRRKACYAISSETRNFQPGLDAVLKELGEEKKVDASDMDAVDAIIEKLKNP